MKHQPARQNKWSKYGWLTDDMALAIIILFERYNSAVSL